MKLQDLTTPEGINELVAVAGRTKSYYNQPQSADQVMEVAAQAIAQNPNLAHLSIKILPNFPNAFYNYDKGELLLGLINPSALAHELGHANNLRQQGLYQKVLRAAQGITRANNVLALPTVLALRTFIQDPQRQDDILKTLAAISAAAAAPELLEETTASLSAIKNHPNRAQAIATLGPALLAHYASGMAPAAVYQLGRP